MQRFLIRVGLVALATATSLAACTMVSGLEELTFVDAGPEADAGPDGAGGSGGADAATPPVAELSTAPIDFGFADCGGPGPANATLTVKNTGGSPLDLTASVGTSSAFSLVSGATAQVAPGESADVVIAVSPMPASATAGAVITGNLNLQTSDPEHASVNLPLSVTARGATLVLMPTIASFPLVQVGSASAPLPLTLTNTGNAPVDVSFGAPDDPQFGLTYTGEPAAVTIPPNGVVPGLEALFTPASNLQASASAEIQTSGAVCGASAQAIPFAGQGTSGEVEISTLDLFFGDNGLVDCGTAAPAEELTLHNAGNATFDWNSSFASGSYFTVSPANGSVLPNQTVTLTITPKGPIPVPSPTTPDAFGDQLTVTTSVPGDAPHVIGLHKTAYGAVLAVQGSTNLGSIPVAGTQTNQLLITNSGNTPVDVQLTGTGAGFSVAPSMLTAQPNMDAPFDVTFSPGGVAGTYAGTLTLAASGAPLCDVLPGPLTLSGEGLSGAVAFAPGALDFGQVDCGKQGVTRTVTFTNSGTLDYTITTALAKGAASAFSVTTCAGGVVPKGGSCAITVTSAGPQTADVAPNMLGDLLTVTTSVSGDTPHVIPLRLTARGAVLTLSMAPIDFGLVRSGGEQRAFNLSVTNRGNKDAKLALSGLAAPFKAPNTLLAPGSNAKMVEVVYAPPTGAFQTDQGSLVVTPVPGEVFCAPPPTGTIQVSGSSKAGSLYTILDKELLLEWTCGGPLPSRTFLLQSASPGSTTVTAAMAGGTSSRFSVTPTSVSVGTGSITTFTVTAKPITGSVDTSFNAYTDYVRVTTGSEERHIYVRMSAMGAVLAFAPGAVAMPSTPATKSFLWPSALALVNSGSRQVSVALSISGGASSFVLTPMAPQPQAWSGTSIDVLFSPATAGAKSASVSIPSATPLCAPLPAPVMITGTGL